jgi:multidrug resistance protein, MATE family
MSLSHKQLQYVSETRALFKIATPVVIAQLAQMSIAFIDTLMASMIDEKAVASLSVATNLYNPVVVFLMGLFIAMNPIIAQLRGAKSSARIQHVFHAGLLVAIIISLPTMMFFMASRSIFETIGINQPVIEDATSYLLVLSFGIPFQLLFYATRFTNEGFFRTRNIMTISLLAVPINIFFNYLFISGNFGVPALGVKGIALASVMVWIFLFFSLYFWSLRSNIGSHFQIKLRLFLSTLRELKEIINVGLPISISIFFEILLFSMVGLMIGRMTIDNITANQIANNITSMTFMIPLGISIAVCARTGFAMGKNNLSHLKRIIGCGFFITALSVIANASLLVFWRFEIAQVYTDSDSIISLTASLLLLAAFYQLSDGAQICAQGVLRGLKDTKIPMLLTLFSYWLFGFPSGYYLAEVKNLGPVGYWIGLIIGLSFAGLMLLWRVYKVFQKKRALQPRKQMN